MRGLAGLRGQHLASPIQASTTSLIALPFAAPNPAKRLEVYASPASLNASSQNGTVTTPWLTLDPVTRHRGAVYASRWIQLLGPPSTVIIDGPLRARFQHSLASGTSAVFDWRAVVWNQFGQASEIAVAYTLTRTEPAVPPLVGTGSPSGQVFSPINPATRSVTVSFSVSVSGGEPPYTYDWGGGSTPTSASNSATLVLPVEATEGYDFTPGCTVRDSGGRQITVGAGPFFIYDGPPMG